MSIITSLLKKAAPERFALYQEHVRYEKAKQFHNLRVADGTSNGHLRETANNLADTIRTTRDERVRQNLQNMQIGINSELASRLDQFRENQNLSIGTHLRLWRQAADSFRAGYNRFSLAALLKRDVGRGEAGWLMARGANGKALDTNSLTDIMPAPRMSREEALRTIEKRGVIISKNNTNDRFNDGVGVNSAKKESPALFNAAKAAFFTPLSGRQGFTFTAPSNSHTTGGVIEHTLIHRAPKFGSVALPPALGKASANDVSSSPATEDDIAKFYHDEAKRFLIKKEELENAENPDPAELAKVEKRLADAFRIIVKYERRAPDLAPAISKFYREEAARFLVKKGELENARDPDPVALAKVEKRLAVAFEVIAEYEQMAPAITTRSPDDVPLNPRDTEAGYCTVGRRITAIPEVIEAEEPTYLDMSGVHAAPATLPVLPPRPAPVLAKPVVGPAGDAQLIAMGDFQAAWRVSSGAANAKLTAAKNALKKVATEQFRTLADENPARLGEWRKNIQERFYAFKIELSNAQRAGDDTGYLEALTQVHIAQAEFDEATRLFFANKIEHAAQAKFISTYERQAAKVTTKNNALSPELVEATAQLKEAAAAHFAKTYKRLSADDRSAHLLEAKARYTQLAITGATLRKERKALDDAGHTPFTAERTELRTRGALYFAQSVWTDEWIRFLENRI